MIAAASGAARPHSTATVARRGREGVRHIRDQSVRFKPAGPHSWDGQTAIPAWRISMARVLIIGASKGIGLETTRQALEAGHQVRALARSAAGIGLSDPKLEKVRGNALISKDIERNQLGMAGDFISESRAI